MGIDKFAERIRVAADLIGGQLELSRRSGISSKSINSYALGTAEPSRPRLVAMAKAANVSAGWLATGEGPMRPGEEQSGKLARLEEPVITELKLWLNEQRGEENGIYIWFRVELQKKFPEFKEWLEKKRGAEISQQSSAA